MKSKKRTNKKKKLSKEKPNYKLWLALIVILLTTFIVYYRSIDYGFVYWDDDVNIFENQLVTTFTWETFWNNTKAIFSVSNHVIGNYNPLTTWTFGIENAIYGSSVPQNMHLLNLILHLAVVLLVFQVGRKMQLPLPVNLLVAALFALHPMRVESVAWITERKDVLYALFFYSAWLVYFKHRKKPSIKTWAAILLLFSLSLLSKVQAVTLPLVFVLTDYWYDRRLSWKSIYQKWPFFILSTIIGVVNIYTLSSQGSLEANNTFNLFERFFIGSSSLVVFLVKSAIPYRMSPIYPYPPGLEWYHYVSIISFPLFLYILYIAYKREWKVLFFGLAFFGVNIVFLLQIFGAGQGLMADRFTYVAYMGLFIIFAYYVIHYYNRPKTKLITSAAITLVLATYIFLSYKQVGIWQNSETLWSQALRYYKNSTLPYGNRANYFRDRGLYQEALRDYNKSLSLDPKQSGTLNSRAKLYFTIANGADQLNAALQDYNSAIQLKPDNGEYYINRGATLARLGRTAEAMESFNRGLILKPDHASGYSNRFILHAQSGNWQAALNDANSYLKYRPYDANFHFERGNAKFQLNPNDVSAFDDIENAIRLDPQRGVFHYRKAVFLMNKNQIPEAKQAYQQAIALGYQNVDRGVASRLGQ